MRNCFGELFQGTRLYLPRQRLPRRNLYAETKRKCQMKKVNITPALQNITLDPAGWKVHIAECSVPWFAHNTIVWRRNLWARSHEASPGVIYSVPPSSWKHEINIQAPAGARVQLQLGQGRNYIWIPRNAKISGALSTWLGAGDCWFRLFNESAACNQWK